MCAVVSQLVSVSSSVWLQVVQHHLGSSLQDELSRHGRPTAVPWQQQRLHLRPVTSLASSPRSRSGSPTDFHSADAAVDTLLQQRSKLKPVQTSKHAILPAKRPAAAPLRKQDTAAAAYPSFVKATTTRPAAPSQGTSACFLSKFQFSSPQSLPKALLLGAAQAYAACVQNCSEVESVTLQCLYRLRVT